MSPVRGGRRASTRQRRKLIWARTSGSFLSPTIVGVNAPLRVDMLQVFELQYGAALIGCTIMRIRGIIGVTQTAGGGNVAVAAKIADRSDIIPAPIVDENPVDLGAHDDWMMYEPFFTGFGFGGTDTQARMIDVRSRRKLDELNQSLLLYVGVNSSAAGNLTTVLQLSTLIALP